MPEQISILMPARDAAATIDDALASIAAQTYPHWELIVVDDGSRDETPSILAAWSAREARIRVLRHPEGKGIVAALNTALAAAGGLVIVRMDADDIALPERLERQVAALRRLAPGDWCLAGKRQDGLPQPSQDPGARSQELTPIGAIGCQVRYFPEAAVGAGSRRYEAWLNGLITPEEHARDIFVECPLAHPTFMLLREALEAVGGYRACGWPEDYDLLLRLWQHGYGLAKVPEVLLLWRESEARASRVHPDYGPEAFRRCKIHYLRQTYLSRGRPALVWGAGRVGKLLARELIAAGTPLDGFVELDPRKIGQSIYGAPVFSLPDALARRGAPFGLAAVGQAGAREEIRATLQAAGWIEGQDFCCVA
jgi:cellulose synthase/poly-beta-1,6-N-acetylglucosamine synthase-like glycosyltransferase